MICSLRAPPVQIGPLHMNVVAGDVLVELVRHWLWLVIAGVIGVFIVSAIVRHRFLLGLCNFNWVGLPCRRRSVDDLDRLHLLLRYCASFDPDRRRTSHGRGHYLVPTTVVDL